MPPTRQSPTILQALSDAPNKPLLLGILRGIEKEGLRTTLQGCIAQSPHPKSLGSSLHHPLITTDYSEALLEFITPPTHRLDSLFQCLDEIHTVCHLALEGETLWCNSMPCELAGDASIPIANYGSSNRGRMKSVYRRGLGHRYGRVMQAVAGIHYNFSLPQAFWAFLQQQEGSTEDLQDFISRRYFDLIRNFRRHYWLLIYLFGASPALSSSFVTDRAHNLLPLAGNPETLYLPFATSLRMGDLGYQSSAQEGLYVCYNSARSYAKSLVAAINTPYPAYEQFSRHSEGEEFQQLNTGLLQIENEFYSAIRPKRTARAGETALTALCGRGVEYIEIRCLDINPFEPNGLAKAQIRFLDAFLLHCLLTPSDGTSNTETHRILRNQKSVVTEGRKPGLLLEDDAGNLRPFTELALNLTRAIEPMAQLLDVAQGETLHQDALVDQIAKIVQPDLTPSALALSALQASRQSFTAWAQALSLQHRDVYLQGPALGVNRRHFFNRLAEDSLMAQAKEEAEPQMDFAAYLCSYYAQYPVCSERLA